MTKEDKIKELEVSVEMYKKDIEDAKEETAKELLRAELDEKSKMIKVLKDLTDDEFDVYMKLKLPLDKKKIQEVIDFNKRKHEMVDIPESHVHIGLTKKDISYLYSEPLQERTTEQNYDSKVIDSESADYSERKFTEGELKCLNNVKEMLKPAIDERKGGKQQQTEDEKEKKVKIRDEENRLGAEKYKIKKLHNIGSIEDFKNLYSVNEPFMSYFYLCTIPEYFDVEENEIIDVFFNRETHQIGLTIRESVGKYQVINFVKRLNEDNKKQGFFSKLFGKKQEKRNEEIIVRHLASNGVIEYTEVYSGVVLKGFCEDALAYSNNSYRTLNATFEYEKVTFYKKFDFGDMYGVFDSTDIENKLKSYSEEKLNEIIENSEIEKNVELAKKELERREEEMKKKVDTFKDINKQVEELDKNKNKQFGSVYVEDIKTSEMEEGVKYIEKGTGTSATYHKKDDLMTYEEYKDGTTEEKDNKEDVQE